MKKLLIDTDIIIDHLRGHTSASEFLIRKGAGLFFVSAMTVAELYAGVRNKTEETAIETILSFLTPISIDHEIASASGHLCNQYSKSHGTSIQDAIIAATAQHHNISLVTLNTKHFPMLETIKPYAK